MKYVNFDMFWSKIKKMDGNNKNSLNIVTVKERRLIKRIDRTIIGTR